MKLPGGERSVLANKARQWLPDYFDLYLDRSLPGRIEPPRRGKPRVSPRWAYAGLAHAQPSGAIDDELAN